MTTTSGTSDLRVTRTEHPNATMMRESFAAFARGDLHFLAAQTAENSVWTNSGANPLSGEFRGWDAIVGMFGQLLELTGGTWRSELVSVTADDTHSVGIYDATATVGGRTATNRFVLIDELDSGGKVLATHNLAFDQAAADAVFQD